MLKFYKDQLNELRELVIEKENIIIKYEKNNMIEIDRNV